MSSVLSAPPERPRRLLAVPRLSADPNVRSIQVGVAATIIIHLLLLVLMPAMFRNNMTGIVRPAQAKPQFNIEIAPETFTQPKPPNPLKFVETNPDAPDNAPDKTNNFGAQNQQVAQEKPTPDSKSDRPAIEGQTEIHSTQIVDGHLTQPNIPKDAAPPVQTPPATETVAATKREQDPLTGFEKAVGESADSFGSNIAKAPENAQNVPEKVEGVRDAPLVQSATATTMNIDPRKPQPRPQLTKNVRQAIFEENKIGTSNIGPVAYDAKWSSYGQYLQKMIEAIQARWDDLISASKHYPQPGSHVTVTFQMDSAGKIAAITTVDGDTDDLAKNWCVTAISPSQDFTYGIWPADMIAVLGEKQELTFTFLYR
jgi:hypothetical protein